jgi:hypothetical protein
MDRKIFLKGYSSKRAVNTSEGLNVRFKGNKKLLPLNDFIETVSQYDQYLEERSKCNTIRLTCQINPICSNILFNQNTEIVKNEGSSDITYLNYGVGNKNTIDGVIYKSNALSNWTPYNAISDTQLSNKGFIYHCGLDIFNNHLIRSNTFKVVCKSANENNVDFNTISDMMRDVRGNQISETLTFPTDANFSTNPKTVSMHLYEMGDVLTFNETVDNKLIKKYNGWVGFENTSKIKSYKDFKDNDTDMEIERPLMNYNGGDFIDMYPSRDLYSFVPKYNSKRKRIEKNWNYCITYPSSSITEGFEEIIDENTNGLKCLKVDDSTRADNGVSQLVLYSICKHGLKSGDFVNIYEGNEKIIDNVEVNIVVNDFVFTTFSTFKIKNVNNISYKKVVNGIECKYYVRVFSKLPNFKFASGDTSTMYELYKNNGKLISTYQDKKYDFESHVSRLAFSKNVYTDEIGQIVFTDNIDISNLKDNLNRPLSSLFLTIIKNNKGYKEWYGFDNNSWQPIAVKDENIEYSHCFGKVTCGIETCEESKGYENIDKINIHTMHFGDGFDVESINSGRTYKDGSAYVLTANEVHYDSDKHFYGDICYYDNYNALEVILQPFYHRFNTAQREASESQSRNYFNKYQYDEIVSDDYDDENWKKETITQNNPNEQKEGYYYNPHYALPIKTFDKIQTAMPDFLTILNMSKVDSGRRLDFKVMERHFLTIGDKAILFDMYNNKYYYLTATSIVNEKEFISSIYDENNNVVLNINLLSKNNYKLFKIDNLAIPSYATILRDGTCRLIWRDIVNNGLNRSDTSVEEYPFTNGSFYINKKIDIYVRRQDPYSFWGLYDTNAWGLENKDIIMGVDVNIENEDNFVKENEMAC